VVNQLCPSIRNGGEAYGTIQKQTYNPNSMTFSYIYNIIKKTNDVCQATTVTISDKISGKQIICKPQPALFNYNLSISMTRNTVNSIITGRIINSANKLISSTLCLYIANNINGIVKHLLIPINILTNPSTITPTSDIQFTLYTDDNKNINTISFSYTTSTSSSVGGFTSISESNVGVPPASTMYAGATMGNLGTGFALKASTTDPISISHLFPFQKKLSGQHNLIALF
jgi:hypothetical protein